MQTRGAAKNESTLPASLSGQSIPQMDDEWARWRGTHHRQLNTVSTSLHMVPTMLPRIPSGSYHIHIYTCTYPHQFTFFSPLPVLEPSSPLHLRGVGGVTHTKDAADLLIPRALPEDLAKLSGPTPPDHSHDRHDIYDSTPPHLLQQRQHAALARAQAATPDLAARTPSPSSSHLRTLRRTPRFDATPSPPAARRVHLEAASVGFAPRVHFVTANAPQSDLSRPLSPLRIRPRDSQQQKEPAKPRRILSQDLTSIPLFHEATGQDR
ncbi:hypothetical protein HYQ46_004009 [Verticillium longisporum]|nr:hypothetical protein HYQ46_004009 [Verticillium longisporum]